MFSFRLPFKCGGAIYLDLEDTKNMHSLASDKLNKLINGIRIDKHHAHITQTYLFSPSLCYCTNIPAGLPP